MSLIDVLIISDTDEYVIRINLDIKYHVIKSSNHQIIKSSSHLVIKPSSPSVAGKSSSHGY